MRTPSFNAVLGRGVYVAPWLGQNGETILVSLRRDGRMVAERRLLPGDDHLGASDALWAELDLVDPEPRLKVI